MHEFEGTRRILLDVFYASVDPVNALVVRIETESAQARIL